MFKLFVYVLRLTRRIEEENWFELPTKRYAKRYERMLNLHIKLSDMLWDKIRVIPMGDPRYDRLMDTFHALCEPGITMLCRVERLRKVAA